MESLYAPVLYQQSTNYQLAVRQWGCSDVVMLSSENYVLRSIKPIFEIFIIELSQSNENGKIQKNGVKISNKIQ